MKLYKYILILLFALLMCSCPESNCEEEHDPKGFVVKMRNDYSDKVLVLMNVNSSGDTTYCCSHIKDHTKLLLNDYYILHCHSYKSAVYTSISSNNWDEEYMNSISNYVIDTNP